MRSLPPAVAGGSIGRLLVVMDQDPPATAGGTDLITPKRVAGLTPAAASLRSDSRFQSIIHREGLTE